MKKFLLSIPPFFILLMLYVSVTVHALNSIYNYSLIEMTQPIDGEHVMGIIETENYILIKTEKGIWRSTDWNIWTNVLNISSNPSSYSPWYVFDKLPNGWIFASFLNSGCECYVSKDNGSTWIKVNTYMRGSLNSITQLPNGTILTTPHSADDGGIIWASEDGLDWRIWQNLTEIGQSIGWLNSTQRHRHAHHVFFDSEFGLFAVGGEGSIPNIKRTVYYDDTSPYGDSWKVMGEGLATTEIVKIPNALVLFPDYDDYPDIKCWNGLNVLSLNILQTYTPKLSPKFFRCVYKPNQKVIIAGIQLCDSYRQGGILLLSDDLKTHKIIESSTESYCCYDVFDGLDNHVYILQSYYNLTTYVSQPSKLYKFTINPMTPTPTSTKNITQLLQDLVIHILIPIFLVSICLELIHRKP